MSSVVVKAALTQGLEVLHVIAPIYHWLSMHHLYLLHATMYLVLAWHPMLNADVLG